MRYPYHFLILTFLLTSLCFAGYLPKGDPVTNGLKNQAMLFVLDPPGYHARSRMPWISADDKTLYFTVGDYGYEEIWYSRQSAGTWLSPQRAKGLNLKGYSTQSPSLNREMTRIYFTSNRPVEGVPNSNENRWRIFTATRLPNGAWDTPYIVNQDTLSGNHITGFPKSDNFSVFISRDEQTLYFSSNQSGGKGNGDIWYSQKNAQGRWSGPINIGSPINSIWDESAGISLTEDNLQLYFASNRTDLRSYRKNTWNIYRAIRYSSSQPWSSAIVTQVDDITPTDPSNNWGASWPCISSSGNRLYFSDVGPMMWHQDDFDLYVSNQSSNHWQTPTNLGRLINNIIWYKDDDFLPYIAYLDKDTEQPKDWMFDSLLIVALGGSSSNQNFGWNPTVKDDWIIFLNQIFSPERQLAKLDETTGVVKHLFKIPEYQLKIFLMIPYPNPGVIKFAEANSTSGAPENLLTEDNRFQAVHWYLNEAIHRWNLAGYKHLKLTGFYWMNEDIHEDALLVWKTAQELHQKQLLLEWLPYYNSDVEKWKSCGIDICGYQPNYAWMGDSKLKNKESPDPRRLVYAAQTAKTYGTGIELEWDERVLQDGINFRTYLDYGTLNRQGYMMNSFLAYYQGADVIKLMAYQPEEIAPYARDAYDSLYQYIKGTYPVLLSLGRSYEYNTGPQSPYDDPHGKKLTDGLYVPDTTTTGRVVGFFNQDPLITIDLVRNYRIEKVYAHLIGGNYNGVGYPSLMEIETSSDGTHWQKVGSTSHHPPEKKIQETGDMVAFTQGNNARYVRVRLIHKFPWIWLDEIQVYGR